jgi:hypothetical protein
MGERRRASGHDQSAGSALRECNNGSLDLAGIAQIHRAQIQAQHGRKRLQHAELAGAGGNGGIAQHSDALNGPRDQPLLSWSRRPPARCVVASPVVWWVAPRRKSGSPGPSVHQSRVAIRRSVRAARFRSRYRKKMPRAGGARPGQLRRDGMIFGVGCRLLYLANLAAQLP